MATRQTAGRPTSTRRRATREDADRLSVKDLDWRGWWGALGKQSREIREFVGFSQEQVARLAGVSQGAVSRLEAGRGLGTPMIVIVKVGMVLRRALARLDPSVLNDNLRRFLLLEERLSPPVGGTGFVATPISGDTELDDLVRLYRTVPERHRETFLSVVRAIARSLAGRPADDDDPS